MKELISEFNQLLGFQKIKLVIMKFLLSMICTAALAFALSLYLPWWIIAVAAFVVSFFIPQKNILAFLVGFLAIFILWVSLSMIISSGNNDIFSHKLSLLIIKMDNPVLLIAFTGLIGALVAGFAALSGNIARKILVKNS